MNVHEKITKLCKARGWSLFRLAKEACIPTTTVYNWYNENHFTPSRDKIEDVCAAFKISVAEFYADVDADLLTGREVRLLEGFRRLSEADQERAICIIQILNEEKPSR